MALSYSKYLKLDELLQLQEPLSEAPEHDEMLFIIIHQIYELWFKQVLHEIGLLQLALENNHTPTAMRTLKRVLTIFKTLVSQVDILETMTPVSFSSFRERLDTASGFQSVQFRELEFVLGARNHDVLGHYAEGSPARERLERLLARPSLYDSFLRYLKLLGFDIPRSVLERDLTQPPSESAKVQEVLIGIYAADPTARQVCELLVDLDEGLQEWRYRHLKMVQRTIGTKQGTGGSDGVDYLRTTILKPVFPDLWAIRDRL